MFSRFAAALLVLASVNGDGTSARSLLPSQGEFRVIVLLVRFTDHKDRVLPEKEHFEQLCNEEIVPYLYHQSYGTYKAECDVFDWEDTNNTEAFYADGVSNLKATHEASMMFHSVLTKLDGQNKIDWSKYDVDQNAKIDSLLVFHSGYAAEQGHGVGCGENPPQNRIFSQGHKGSNFGWMNKDGSTRISGFALASAFDLVCEGTAKPATMGVMTHEYIHQFGSPDLYDASTRASGKLGGLGLYDVMSNPFGPKRDGRAGSLSAYTKERAGWVTPKVIQHDGEYEIQSSARSPDVYRIELSNPLEYLLIENRGQLDYDDGMPGSGLLIYHVDDALPHQNMAGFPGQENWPQNGNHYKVAVLATDGNYDLEKDNNNGDAGDYWGPGDVLGDQDDMYPNTHSYQGGVVTRTGIVISGISEPGLTMKFTVTGIAPAPEKIPTKSPSMGPVVLAATAAPTTEAPTTQNPVPPTAQPTELKTVTLPPTQNPASPTAQPTKLKTVTLPPTNATTPELPGVPTMAPTIQSVKLLDPTNSQAPTLSPSAHPLEDEVTIDGTKSDTNTKSFWPVTLSAFLVSYVMFLSLQ